MVDKIYDCIIIGAGPAGMTAAIYLGRANKTVALIDKNGFGGNIANSPKVENIPGFTSISGADFASGMFEQVSALPTVEHYIDEAVLLNYKHGLIVASLDHTGPVMGKSLIIATGTKHRELKLDTTDIYYCATCDGPFFKNKNVVVVGSGNTGAAYALELANYCKNVYLCDITATMNCEPIIEARVLENSKIHWLPSATISGVKKNAEGALTSVTFGNGDTIKASAIFAAVGMDAQTDIAKQFVNMDSKKFIITNNCQASTIVPGVFAAGDCTVKDVRQVTTACADGTVAAINVIKFVENLK